MNPTAPMGPPAPLVGHGRQPARGPAWPSFVPPDPSFNQSVVKWSTNLNRRLTRRPVRGGAAGPAATSSSTDTAAAGTGSVSVLPGAQAQYLSPSTKLTTTHPRHGLGGLPAGKSFPAQPDTSVVSQSQSQRLLHTCLVPPRRPATRQAPTPRMRPSAAVAARRPEV